MTENLIIIFADNLSAGHVKPSLAQDIGNDAAIDICKFLLSQIYNEVKVIEYDKIVFYSDYIEEGDLAQQLGFGQEMQTKGDLSIRTYDAFLYGFAAGYKKVLIIGSDTPELKLETITVALNKLNSSDLVLGPSEGGGYYLVGANKMIPEIFNHTFWSDSTSLIHIIQKLSDQKVDHCVLSRLGKINTMDDLRKYKSRLMLQKKR